ncbi:hypothetical protein CLV59_110107 [Chitinophaga dinghuensis]|uniref:Uncharacterized protein n=1 Tax=Chitinophaga dinghuensis TaxID=1539050 RepID=A0A327VV24_9BACT|nr:hypothetical protein [Chitinophaga dinghuensis]RAJ75061.1 hypothetical protein CLV59_110107 [Chitinophaga dinghuensis]
MKKVMIFLAMFLSLGMLGNRANAQVRVNINIGSQPVWGPVGYDYAQYYYMPDIDAYYSIQRQQFVYLQGNRWVFGATLPPSYHYDLYRGYKVVVNDPDPWLRADVYRQRYGHYKGWYGKQSIIRDSHDAKYARGNDHGHDRGRGNDHGDHGDHGRGHGHDNR